MDRLLEKILIVDKKDSPFDFSKTIRDFWFDLIKKEQEFKDISFDLENDESKGDSKEVTLDLKHPNGDNVKIVAQLFSAGGDWQNPVGYFRCQNIGAVKVKFIVIPGPEVNKNLVKSKKGKGYTASEEGDFVKVGDIEKELWKSLEEELNDRMKPEIEEWDVDYKAMRMFESSIDFPREDLDDAIWDKEDDTYTLKDEVKIHIIGVISKYPDKDLNDIAKKIHIVGSIGTNQYSDTADIDVHIVPKDSSEWDEESILDLQVWFNKHRDEIDGWLNEHPIELYIQVNPKQDLMSDSCYNLLSDEWLVGPKIVPMDFDPYKDFSHIVDDIQSAVEDADKLFGELKRDAIDYDVIKQAMERMSGKDKERLLQQLQSKLEELEEDIEALYTKRGEWVTARRGASKPGSPEQALKDVELAKQWRDTNATFKFINRYQYLKTITDLQELLADEEITPDEVDKIKSIMGA